MKTIRLWSEKKLSILKYYADIYQKILGHGKGKFITNKYYIDAFAGPGQYLGKEDESLVPGSPLIALSLPSFTHYVFIDMNQTTLNELKENIETEHPSKLSNVQFLKGDSNKAIQNTLVPKLKNTKNFRGLIFLDPFGAHIDWVTVQSIAQTGKLDMILHFSIFDMHRNIGVKKASDLEPDRITRFDRFFGCTDWQNHTHQERTDTLFLDSEKYKADDFEENIVSFYKKRLIENAGFEFVHYSSPIKHPVTNARFFYLFFASHHKRGDNLAKSVCKKFGE